MKFKINEKQAKQRLDKFLSDSLEDLSRSLIQKLIKQEKVLVNGGGVSAHYRLKEDDEVEIISMEVEYRKDLPDDEKNCCDQEFSFDYIDVIADTSEYLVINKPAGLVSHGAEHIRSVSLADILADEYPEISKIGEDPDRPGIVHRLDKEVSGLMVIPRTQDSFDNLKKQFQDRTVKKEYTALVYGSTDKDDDIIKFPIRKSSDGYRMAAVPFLKKGEVNLSGKRAISEFEVIERFVNFTLIKVRIKTGRTHQIRVHMFAYGHPLVGDGLYNTKRTRELNEKLKLGRVFLVASELSFTDLSGERQNFSLDLPGELKKFLEKKVK